MPGLSPEYRFIRRKKKGQVVDVVHFHIPGGADFEVAMPRALVEEFMSFVTRIRGETSEDAVRRLAVLAANYQCIRRKGRIHEIMLAVRGLGFYELLFWFSKITTAYENDGWRGVCRIVRGFRAIYGID